MKIQRKKLKNQIMKLPKWLKIAVIENKFYNRNQKINKKHTDKRKFKMLK